MEPPDDVPRSPTGRVPKWVLDERAGRTTDTTWRSDPGPSGAAPAPGRGPARGPRRRRRGRAVLAALLVTGFVIGGGLSWQFRDRISPPSVGPAAQGQRQLQEDLPTPGRELAAKPLGTPPPVSAPSSAFLSFDTNPDGRPVAYDPCRPVHYVVRPDGAPSGGSALLAAGIQRISQVTGLTFIGDGSTDEEPRPEREPFQPDRYGDRWAPVLIAWQSEQDNPELASDVAGAAGSVLIRTDGKPSVYVTGQVVLDGNQFAELLTTPGGADEARAIVLHELGHLVGLDHVEDPTQLMFPRSQPGVVDYAAGDLTGLAALGQGPCAPWL